jgi:hypothetical protein
LLAVVGGAGTDKETFIREDYHSHGFAYRDITLERTTLAMS